MSASPEWKQARRTAFVQDILAALRRRPSSLLSFEQVSQQLGLSTVHYLDLHTVALDHIVGSVGRYADFTRAFFPREDHLQQRWQHVEQLAATGRKMPPVELYRVGGAYFVRDGNHRVSVARQLGKTTIEAYVWAYETPVPLQPDSDIDELLSKAAHAAFLELTHLDRLRPDFDIRLTEPDGYDYLLHEIEAYQQILSELDGRALPLDEATALWYELRYLPVTEIVREQWALREFPGRTEADLYLWLCRNRQALEAQYGRRVMMGDAADELLRRASRNPLSPRRLRRSAVWVRRVAVHHLRGIWSSLRWPLGQPKGRQHND